MPSITDEKRCIRALVCGGGNGAHVLAGLGSSHPRVEINVLSLFADEAERWNQAMKDTDFTVTVNAAGKDATTIKTKPRLITKDVALAMEGVDIVVFVVPAFAHDGYLEALKPHIKPGLVLAALPGQAGFEFAIQGIWGDEASKVTIMSFESLPWAARMAEFGKRAEILGTKKTLMGAIQHGSSPPEMDACEMLQKVLGEFPKLSVSGHLLSMTLMGLNGYVHPPIMYMKWKDCDVETGCDEAPLFYHGICEESANLISSCSDEVLEMGKAVMEARPQISLSTTHIFKWYLRVYSEEIKDKSTFYNAIRSNEAYNGLTHPMVKGKDEKYRPDYQHRYLTEDIPYGLVAIRGVADIIGLATPMMDKVITWSQTQLGKEYLVDGKLTGKDLKETRTPQKYGITTLDAMLGL